MDNYIKDISNSIDFKGNELKKINNNLYLTSKEEEILEKYKINYKTVNINELIYLIEEYLNDAYEEIPDLEDVSLAISERNYYMNTNK